MSTPLVRPRQSERKLSDASRRLWAGAL